MFDIGLTELLLIGIVALIVVGPKDLPGMFRTLGRVTGKARAMAREFQRAMEQAADDSGVKDMAKDFRDAASPKDFGTDEMKSFTRDPKAWARNAARKSVLKPEDEGDTDAPAQPDTPDTAATKPETPARPRGPATEALAQARAEAAARRRAEVEAARAGTAAAPATEPQTGADSGPGTERERS